MQIFRKKLREKQIQVQQMDSEQKLRSLAFVSTVTLFEAMESTEAGLTSEVVEERLDEHGKNIIVTERNNTRLHRLREAIVNPFNMILVLVAVVTYITDVFLSHKADYLTVSIILDKPSAAELERSP